MERFGDGLLNYSGGNLPEIIAKIKGLLSFPEYFQEEYPDLYRPQGNSLSPWHSDTNPSLTLHADCGYSHRDNRKYDIFDLYRLKHGGSFQDALKFFKTRLGLNGDDPAPRKARSRYAKPIAVYQYWNAEGNRVLYEVCRCEPKTFPQRIPNPDGTYSWKIPPNTPKVLYRLPRIVDAPTDEVILLVEGEKDVHRAEDAGFYATCAPGGAGPGKWNRLQDKWNIREPLKDRHVVIIPDADIPGRKYAQEIAASLHGFAKSVKIVELFPFNDDGSDFSDWCEGK